MGRIKDENLFQMIHDYIKVYLPNQRCSSPHTIKAYRMALEQLLEYTATQKTLAMSEITFDMLDSEMVSNYLDWLTSEKGCCASTRNHRLACIRSFFKYAAMMNPENIIRQADMDKIPKQKQKTFSGINYMSEEAVQAILKQPDTKTKKGIRDQFFMVLMYDSGARIQEMLDLRVCDIRNGTTPVAILMGKGAKIRSVPLMPETMQHFQNYMKIYHTDETMYSKQPLFYVEQCGKRHPMSDDNVRKFLKKLEKQQRRFVLMFLITSIHIYGDTAGQCTCTIMEWLCP